MDKPTFTTGVNLASARLGARAVFATDAFFAPLERMLADHDAVWIADKYDENGKWMDGWESRRKRVEGHDWAIIRLAVPGVIQGFDVDTSHFTGNYAPACWIEGVMSAEDPGEDADWAPLTGRESLGASAHHYIAAHSDRPVSHLRLHIFPDGGVARLRAYGAPLAPEPGAEIDLAASLSGGRSLAWSDDHYGGPQLLLGPGRGENMGDGWETRRRRAPGFDWIIIALGARGQVERIEVDTAHFKGNFPDRCSLCAADLSAMGDLSVESVTAQAIHWREMLPEQKLSADAVHEFAPEGDWGAVTHVRLNIFPDGGISRLRLFGRVA